MKRYTLAAVVALLVLVPWHEAVRATPPLYTVENLGTFAGLVPTITGINASGQVVGNVAGAAGSQAIRYTNGLGWQALTGLGSNVFSVATGLNAAGDVVGFKFGSTGMPTAFRYRDGSGVEEIAPLPGGSFTQAFGIDAAGTIVGFGDSTMGIQAFRADPGLPTTALPSLNGGFAVACGINAAGQIAGYSFTPLGVQHAMRIDPGASAAVDIAPLDGAEANSQVCAIDADGTVGGGGQHFGVVRAFRHSDAAGGADLDVFNSTGSNVDAIAAGLSVGWYTLEDGTTRAFAHRDGDGSFDLNANISDANWLLLAARGVNANGVIVGDGLLNGAAAAFRLTPVAADSTAPVIASISATPASVAVPNGQLVPVSVTVNASDDSGQAPACSLESISGGETGDAAVTGQFTGSIRAVGGRTYTLHVVCADSANNQSQGTVDVTVATDTTAPVIASVSASPSSIAPADGRVVPVTVSVSATDDVDAAPVCSVTGVTGGAGDSSVTGPLSLNVKAASGANYTVNVRCADAAGNASNAATAVSVVVAPPPPPPHDTKAPVIRFIYAQRNEIRQNNVKWETVKLWVWATDNVDHSPFCSITSITGGPAGSYAITGRLTAKLRENRSLGDLSRTYVLNVKCVDDDGNAATATVGIDPDGRTTYSGDRRRWRW